MEYIYKALDKSGKVVTGVRKAKNHDEVSKFVADQGLVVVSIDQKLELEAGKLWSKLKNIEIGDVPLNEKVIFSRQLATMVAAGLPITQCLEILLAQTKYARMKRKLSNIYKDVQSGIPLSVAFAKEKFIFNELQLGLIAAGERSGNLEKILLQIADDMRKSAQLKGKIRGAMIYPAVIFVVMIIVVAVIMVFMIPAVEGLYKDFGSDELPWVTQVLVDISNFISSPLGLILIFGVSIGSFVTYKSIYSSKGGRSMIDKIKLTMPIFGDLLTKMDMLEFTRLLAMLTRSGIPIIDALKATSKSVSNYHFQIALERAADEVSKGFPLAVPLSKSPVIPLIVVKLVATGEETGKLDQVLTELSNFYNDQVEEITSNLTKIMEPLILVIAGSMVAFLAVAIYLPIYSLGTIIR